ncbi:hypothetical protein [Streptomyces hydrogenans]
MAAYLGLAPATSAVHTGDIIAAVEEALRGSQSAPQQPQAAAPAPAPAVAAAPPQQPQQYANAGTDPVGPHGSVHCPHGQMLFKTGNRKSDQQYYQGYFCAQNVKTCKAQHYQNHT